MTKEHEMSFEKAFLRLEAILEKFNSGTLPLEESLKLYEEAVKLIASSEKMLTSAERTIEQLSKNRTGELTLSPEGTPKTEPLPEA
jgi:exodeoxyribonuclease VII small subunit